MVERPILFSAPMVRALLAGTKTQTRRLVKPVGDDDGFVLQDYGRGWWPYRSDDGESPMKDGNEIPHRCPYGQPGDRLWVREAWSDDCDPHWTLYRADGKAERRSGGQVFDGCDAAELNPAPRWRPSIHMRRALSRITLEITCVRVERLQDISEKDARAEGSPCVDDFSGREVLFPDACNVGSWRLGYRVIWESINGPDSWAANPWVWVVEFRRA